VTDAASPESIPAKKRRERLWLWLIPLLPLLLLGFLALQFESGGPSAKDMVVLIEKGSSLRKAARSLEKAGVIRSADRFLLGARLFGRKSPVKAGEYEIPRHASPARILSLLQSGDVLLHEVLVSTGMSSLQVQERLLADARLTGEIDVPAEGSLLPETYTFTRGEARADVLARMKQSMSTALVELWDKRQPDLPLRTPEEAIILASIVEKESSKKSELPEVAGVYINRLRMGMKLQADPTVIYPVTKGKPLGRRILKSELQADNGYNTYVIAGLPQGPIANPGRAAIAAVLNPARTKNIFFVADGSGGHAFAETLAEHDRNVSRWRRYRAEKGI
jgi:UPF0755 protein